LKKDAYERLQPWLYRKSARQRLILYLIAEGYTVGDLTRMKVGDLRQVKLPPEIDVDRDNILHGRTSGHAFIYPNGKLIPHTAYYRLIRSTSNKVTGRPMSQEKFRVFINSTDR
jgi:hypothetical protein